MTASRRDTILLWVVTGLLALTFLVTGAGKLFRVPPSPENFARWGLSPTFMMAIGIIEVAGGLGLLVPRLAPIAGVVLAGTMVGALRTGIVFHEIEHIILPSVLLVLLGIVIYARRGLLPWRR